jgi:hypothetical protein
VSGGTVVLSNADADDTTAVKIPGVGRKLENELSL